MIVYMKFLVYHKKCLIDEVYYDSDMSAEDVKQSLINHDHYPFDIEVFKIDNV